MLGRVVAVPRFHQIVGAALPHLVPLFSAAFVGLPSLPPRGRSRTLRRSVMPRASIVANPHAPDRR
jgi:hypothetical protein